MSILCDGQIITNNIDEIGNTVSLIAISKSLDTTSYRESTETATTTTGLKAITQVLTTADDLVKEGIFRAGDIIFFFKGSQTGLTPGNRLTLNSINYEINDVIEMRAADTVYAYEVRTKKC